MNFERDIAGSKYSVTIDLSVQVLDCGKKCSLTFSSHKDDQDNIKTLRPWQVKAVEKGFQNSLYSGPILKYPVIQGGFKVHRVAVSGGKVPDVIYSAAMTSAMKSLLREAEATLLEPIMKLVINCELDAESVVLNDVLLRGGEMTDRQEAGGYIILTGNAPLRQLRGFSSHIRMISSGKAFFGMEFSHYKSMDEISQSEAIKEVTGFAPTK